MLFNGSPSDEFQMQIRLRQGNPLSHFLFILVMEGFHVAFEDAFGEDLIKGVSIGS